MNQTPSGHQAVLSSFFFSLHLHQPFAPRGTPRQIAGCRASASKTLHHAVIFTGSWRRRCIFCMRVQTASTSSLRSKRPGCRRNEAASPLVNLHNAPTSILKPASAYQDAGPRCSKPRRLRRSKLRVVTRSVPGRSRCGQANVDN